jgi:hypothetical protein
VRETLSALLPLLQRKDDRGHLDGALREFAEMRRKFNVYVDHVGNAGRFIPSTLRQL